MVDPVKASPPHIILLAFPFGSHAAPLHSLARALAGAAPSAIFSFVSTANSLESLPKASVENLRLRPFEEETTADRSAARGIGEIESFFDASTEKIRAAVKAAEQDAGDVPVSCMVSDAFVWTANLVAEELGLPWVAVFLGFPLAMSVLIHAKDLRARFGTSGRVLESHADTQLDFIPGLSAMRVRDLPEGIVFGDTSSIFALNLDAMVRRLPRAVAVIFPTVPGLEPVNADFNLILPVGPLNLLSPQPFVSDREGCLPWLNGHTVSSVIYIAFGSVATLAPNELAELAHGLEASGAPFLWSLRERHRSSLPEGFIERTRRKGKIVDWAPQLAVLSHMAVGVFVSHCGWSSTLESISAGVVMLCRPVFAEQRMVARAVESVLGIGADVGTMGIAREALVATLSAVLKGDDGKRMRERAAELRERMGKSALEPGGSFAKNFRILVELVCRK